MKRRETEKQNYFDLHELVGSPENGVVMEVLGGIEPEMELHLSAYDPAVAAPSDVHIGLQRVGLPERCSQELYVHLVVEPWMSLAVRKLPMFFIPEFD